MALEHIRPYIAFIPARGGSKGLPGKNLLPFAGTPLAVRAVKAALSVPAIARAIVSTDDRRIAEAAAKAGAEVPFLRPPNLSGDDSPMLDAIRHCLAWLENEPGTSRYRALVHLPPTTPQRTPEHIQAALKLFEQARNQGRDPAAVMTISPTPDFAHPANIFRLREDPTLSRGTYRIIREPPDRTDGILCHRNGACVVLDPQRPQALNLKSGPVMGLMLSAPLVSIDTREDLALAERNELPEQSGPAQPSHTPPRTNPMGTGMVEAVPLEDRYHPKKALVLASDSSLTYYDPSGIDIYRRQQLSGDRWFAVTHPAGPGTSRFAHLAFESKQEMDP